MIKSWSEKAPYPVSECCAYRAMIPLPASGGKPGSFNLVLASAFKTSSLALHISVFEEPRWGRFACAASCDVIMFVPE